jgi:hypothetical protein
LELVGANTTISKKDKILAIKLLEKLTAPYLSKGVCPKVS